jgi:dolichol-phosphate mannosyltransferase
MWQFVDKLKILLIKSLLAEAKFVTLLLHKCVLLQKCNIGLINCVIMSALEDINTKIGTNSDSLVIIPTYNERENAAAIINAVLALPVPFDVIIIDDHSPDGTADIVREQASLHPGRIHMIERAGKLGLGTAYITGFKWALEHNYEYIFEMDADFSHNPNDLPALREACATKGADVAVGSRYLTGVNVVNWPMGRVLMSYYASKYVRLVTGLHVHDTTAGFACYRREVLATMELDKIRFKGYAFQIEMKFTAAKCGFTVTEVPIIFVNRVRGSSKMSSGIFGEALLGVIKLKLSSLTRSYPQKPRH